MRTTGVNDQPKGWDARRGRQIRKDNEMADYLIMIECSECGNEHYFDPESLPGGDEHCEYCEICYSPLTAGQDLKGR